MSPPTHSREWWQELCRSRLASAPRYSELVGAQWIIDQIPDGFALPQSQAHPLALIVCAGDGETLAAAETAFSLLTGLPDFRQRLDSVKLQTEPERAWEKWNEIRSAYEFARAGLPIEFSAEVGSNLRSAPEFTFPWEGKTAGVEVATIAAPAQVKDLRRFMDSLRSAVAEAKKEGIGGAFGGMVPLTDRFEGGWKGVKKIMDIKSGGGQLAACDIGILQIFTSMHLLSPRDFQPEYLTDNGDLQHRHSGRIYNAFYGKQGQFLYWHHFVEHPLGRRSVSKQKAEGRFLRETSLSAAIWTMHGGEADGSFALDKGTNVFYGPVRPADQRTMPKDLMARLDESFRFSKKLSFAPQDTARFPGPS